MTKLKTMFTIIGILLTGLLPALAQSEDTIDFVQFTNSTYGIAGIVPDRWQEISPGVYARGTTPTDVTMLAQQSAPATADQLLNSLLPQLRLSEAPESIGTYESDSFTWTRFQVEVVVPGMTIVVDLALAESEGTTYLALLQAAEDEHDTLYDAVFIPVLDALIPYGETEAAGDDPAQEVVDLPYIAEEVTFEHGEITLAGTLTLPDAKGAHPAVILITGSGPQDRDESIEPLAAIKPFALIADYLTQAGIAVLRYDDRGIGQSTGDFAAATSADFADDTEAALDYLLSRPEIDPQQIGLLGHSEGGLVAAMLAARRPDVAFVISMAGPSVDGRATMISQLERVLRASATDDEVIARQSQLQIALFNALLEGDEDQQSDAMVNLVLYQLQSLPQEQLDGISDLEAYAQSLVAQQLPGYQSDWWAFFLTHDPA
jgi:pimeloyl-ACP methyl ester carboxylesterase